MIIGTIILSLISAILYRFGGWGDDGWEKHGKIFPRILYQTGTRDVGCSLVACLWMVLYYNPLAWWIYLIGIGLLFASFRTYWDGVFEFDNFWFSGFVVGLAFIPYGIATGHWLPVLYRALALAVLWGGWCAIFKNDTIEETGRGVFIIATLPMLLT